MNSTAKPMPRARPPFRADHVGSLLRPERLKAARERYEAGTLSAAGLRAIEDELIRDVARRQEEVGLHAITDGDFRRSSFHVDFLTRFENIHFAPADFQRSFQSGPSKGESPAVFTVSGKIRHVRDIAVADFEFLAKATQRTAKVAMPSPTFVHCRGGRAAIDRTAYPELGPFYADLAQAFRQEIAALAKAGCRYVQLDEVHYTFFSDPKMVAEFRARGDEPAELAVAYAKLINESIAGRPPDMMVGVHLCRGNRRSSWVAQGGYEPVAELLFNTVEADGFFLEYDSDRAGGFEPLRFVPKGKMIVLGLVTSKTSEMETRDGLLRRIEEAARFCPIDQLALSPQCGFASSVPGNIISEDAQWAKLGLIAKVAEEVWGSAH
jgi:5-methyltetrahydropteroyltriglutamate--homocysteine methyltransferase